MKTLQRYSVWLGFALLLSPFAHAQSSPPPLKPNEKIVKTKDGCGMVIDGTSRTAAHETTRIPELTWGGPCVGGLAMGEGWIAEGDYRNINVPPTKGWAWYGRKFGPGELREADGTIRFNQFIWDGKIVHYNTLSTAKLTWPGTGSNQSEVASTETYVSLAKRYQPDGRYIYAVYRLDRQSRESVEYKCPNPHSPQGCDALWAEHAGPVIERIKAFIAENKPKADARKREIAPLIAHWRPSPNAKRNDAARHAALRKQHLAERAKREADSVRMVHETERLQRENQQRQAEQQAKDEKRKAEAERKRTEEQRRDEQEAWALLKSTLETTNSSKARDLATLGALAVEPPEGKSRVGTALNLYADNLTRKNSGAADNSAGASGTGEACTIQNKQLRKEEGRDLMIYSSFDCIRIEWRTKPSRVYSNETGRQGRIVNRCACGVSFRTNGGDWLGQSGNSWNANPGVGPWQSELKGKKPPEVVPNTSCHFTNEIQAIYSVKREMCVATKCLNKDAYAVCGYDTAR